MFQWQQTSQNILEVHLRDVVVWVHMLGKFRELAVSWQACRDSWIFSQQCIAGELLSSDQKLKLQWDRSNFQCLLWVLLPLLYFSMMGMGNFEISKNFNSIWYFSQLLKYKVKWENNIGGVS